jgi:hypothetical protein
MRNSNTVGIIAPIPNPFAMWALSVFGCLFLAAPALCFQPTLNGVGGPVYRLEFLTSKSTQENGTLLELCGEILPANLRFKANESGYQALYELTVAVFDRQDDFVASSSQKDTLKISSLAEIADLQPSYLIVPFVLPPERYKAVVLVEDLQSSSFSRFTKNIDLPDYSKYLTVSDLRLSPSIVRARAQSPAVKSGWRIRPNPSRHFGTEARAVYVYSEVYNLSFEASEPEQGVLSTYTIKDIGGATLNSFEIPNIKIGCQSVLVAMIPIYDLKSGRYQLVLTVRDLETGLEVDRSAYFFVARSGLLAERL